MERRVVAIESVNAAREMDPTQTSAFLIVANCPGGRRVVTGTNVVKKIFSSRMLERKVKLLNRNICRMII